MRSFRILNRRAGLLGVVSALVFGFVAAPFASAATVSDRSIGLSSANTNATGVHYTVNFKPVTTAGAVVVDFCAESPLLGQTCNGPLGLDVTTPTTTTSGFTVAALTAHTIRATGTLTGGNAYSIDVAGLKNPSSAGVVYARIVTYDTANNANLYTSTGVAEGAGGQIDNGGVALSFIDKIAVSAAVLESMTFCVSGAALTAGCTGVTAPTLKLGEGTGDVLALSSAALSTGTIHTQLSTNAAGGAIVSLKSGNNCGGLKRSAATVCDIAPAGNTGTFTFGTAKFGLHTSAAAAASGGTNNGTLATESGYNTTDYRMNYVAGDATGVTSTYGDPLINSAAAPVSNMNMDLTFGASITDQTPAGLYSNDLSLIATGKF